MKNSFYFLLFFPFTVLFAQNTYLVKENDQWRLTSAGASFLAKLPLHCIHTEYPNKTGHTIEAENDAKLTPKQLHPAFYGCLDWHSSVHGHWMLVRLLKTFKGLPEETEIRKILDDSFQPDKMKTEAEYFTKYKFSRTFERTYGWAWLLKLDEELATWDDPQGRQWHQHLRPLTQQVVELWTAFLPKQTYPNRTGVHPNTAFGLVFALDYARTVKNAAFEAKIVEKAKYFYLNNTQAPAIQEPDGSDFLSPSLEVADLMRRILTPTAFTKWFNGFMPAAGLQNILKLPVISDRNDMQIVHLDGLSLSRAWCLKGIVGALPKTDSRRANMLKASQHFINTTLPQITNGGYGGEHWLASFALYALQ
ncbi:DUF2891 domain-containing protein [Runella sp. SP2]|uniref:DUF2891 domain-containing protein n=1 Tax=Runella sp. SP2 TaxID=2268026 RepID=UPI000F08A8DB|nr:DUF2891 domain-containing protein [Runella sp. SP2]AYQ36155.1 DUF2891 domain-containing protein [Runella sp. SP2]